MSDSMHAHVTLCSTLADAVELELGRGGLAAADRALDIAEKKYSAIERLFSQADNPQQTDVIQMLMDLRKRLDRLKNRIRSTHI